MKDQAVLIKGMKPMESKKVSDASLWSSLIGKTLPWWSLFRLSKEKKESFELRLLLSQCDEQYKEAAHNQTKRDFQDAKLKSIWIYALMVVGALWAWFADAWAITNWGTDMTLIELYVMAWGISWMFIFYLEARWRKKKVVYYLLNCSPSESQPLMLLLMGLVAGKLFHIDDLAAPLIQTHVPQGALFPLCLITTGLMAYLVYVFLCENFLSSYARDGYRGLEILRKLEKKSQDPASELYAKKKALEEHQVLESVTAPSVTTAVEQNGSDDEMGENERSGIDNNPTDHQSALEASRKTLRL